METHTFKRKKGTRNQKKMSLVEQIVNSSLNFFSSFNHADGGAPPVRICPHLVAGPRSTAGARRNDILENVHRCTAAATKRRNHFHSGGTPSQLRDTIMNVERRIEALRRGRVKKQECTDDEEVRLLVVTVDDFDVLSSLHKMQHSSDVSSSGNDDDASSSSGVGKFAASSSSSQHQGQQKESKRDLWGCLFDFSTSQHDIITSTSVDVPICILLVVSATTTSTSDKRIFGHQSSSPAPSSLLSSAALARWIFPHALTWEVSQPHSDLAAAAAAAAGERKTKKQSSSLPLETLARRNACGAAFGELRETIFRFALHAGISTASRFEVDAPPRGGEEFVSSKAVGAVAKSLEPPSGVLIFEQPGDHDDYDDGGGGGGGGGGGRPGLVAELGIEYAKRYCPGLSTLSVEAPLLFGPIFGETEERIRGAFADAYAARPCVLVIHNVEAVAATRGSVSSSCSSSSSSSGNVLQRAVATFLCEADGVDRPDRASSVLLVATTSRRGEMDEAALRPGRLEQHLLLANELRRHTLPSVSRQQQRATILTDSIESFVSAWARAASHNDSPDCRKSLETALSADRIPVDTALRAAQRIILQEVIQ